MGRQVWEWGEAMEAAGGRVHTASQPLYNQNVGAELSLVPPTVKPALERRPLLPSQDPLREELLKPEGASEPPQQSAVPTTCAACDSVGLE